MFKDFKNVMENRSKCSIFHNIFKNLIFRRYCLELMLSKVLHTKLENDLLFISYKFAKGFLAITVLLLFFRTETFMKCVNVFLCSIKEKKFQLDPTKKTKNFPIDLHCKNRPLW